MCWNRYGNLIKCPCLETRGNDADNGVKGLQEGEGVPDAIEARVRASLGDSVEPDRASLLQSANGKDSANTKASELPPLPEMNSV